MTKPTDLILAARMYALEAHGNQKYGDLPYSYHLTAVTDLLKTHGFDDIVIAAGWLHDVVEDTTASLFDIRERFGGRVARIVDACTDGAGETRKERKAEAYKKLAASGSDARAVKLADRVANMQASIENAKMAKTYRDEFPDFIRVCGGDINWGNQALELKAFWLYMNSVEAYGKD